MTAWLIGLPVRSFPVFVLFVRFYQFIDLRSLSAQYILSTFDFETQSFGKWRLAPGAPVWGYSASGGGGGYDFA